MSFLSQPISLQTLFGKQRTIGPIMVQTILNEHTVDTLTITKQPIQQGASITDHSYKEPVSLTMNILQKEQDLFFQSIVNTFSGNGLKKLYQDFLDLQNQRLPFTVVTPKRVYKSMLIASLSLTTDKATENTLSLSVTFQEAIIVSVLVTQVPRSNQKNAGKTGATQNAGKKSALLSAKQGIGALFK